MADVVPPDLADFLIGRIRERINADGVVATVGNREPSSDDRKPLPEKPYTIVVRNDSGPRLDLTTFSHQVGITVIGGTKSKPKPVRDVARRVFAIATSDDLCVVEVGNPIASVEETNGPYDVDESTDRARVYMTVEYVVVGTPV